jgi:uncharacterized integral membrane protein (TIGR00697 family)
MDRKTQLLLALMTLHSSLAVTSTIAGAKLFAITTGFFASATVFSYMLTFLALDSIAELFGKEYARFVINVGLLAMALSAIYFQFSIWLPPAPEWHDQPAFQAVFGRSWRIWLGGWTAYIVSQYLSLWSFVALRKISFQNWWLSFCAWASMLLGQLVDTLVFLSIAFYGTDDFGHLLVGQFTVKIIVVTFATPFVSLVVAIGRKFIQEEGLLEAIRLVVNEWILRLTTITRVKTSAGREGGSTEGAWPREPLIKEALPEASETSEKRVKRVNE